MKNIVYTLLLTLIFTACEKDEYIDTGKADPYFKGSILGFLQANPEEFSLTLEVIQAAGLNDVFDGSNPDYRDISFLAFNNFAITRFMLLTTDDEGNRLYNNVSEIPVEITIPMILSHVLKGRFVRTDIDYEVKGTLQGGNKYENLMGNTVRMFCREVAYQGVIDKRAASLYVQGAGEDGEIIYVASPDHQADNGNIHILSNTYQWSVL